MVDPVVIPQSGVEHAAQRRVKRVHLPGPSRRDAPIARRVLEQQRQLDDGERGVDDIEFCGWVMVGVPWDDALRGVAC